MWVEVAKDHELKEGTLKVVEAGGQEVLLAKVNGRIHATQALCGHMNMYLHAGKLEGNTVTCPFHGAKFDLTSGKVLSPHDPQIDQYLEQLKLPKIPDRPLKTYKVRVENNAVAIQL